MPACSFCSFQSSNTIEIVKHLFQAHNSEDDFKYVCGISSCTRTFTKGSSFDAFRSHCARYHHNWRELVSESLIESEVDTTGTSVSMTEDCCIADGSENVEGTSNPDLVESRMLTNFNDDYVVGHVDTVKVAAANLILTLKEKFKLPQSAIDYTIQAVEEITMLSTDSMKKSVTNNLLASGLSINPSFNDCSSNSPFMELKTEYQQTKFFKENFGLVESVTQQLGTSFKYKKIGSSRRLIEIQDTFEYVPLLDNLERLLCNQDVFEEVTRSHTRNDHLIGDYCDGLLFKNHPLFGCNDGSLHLQFIVYYDDVEVTNPLGSRRGKYKLGLFYYVLGNIQPKYRSTLKAIQLIAAITCPLLKEYGYEHALKPFIEDMKKMRQGCHLTIKDKKLFVKGAVLAVLADTQAAHILGGFKVGVGFALRQCRECLATKDTMNLRFKECQFVQRTPETYDYHCSLLLGTFADADSVTYGVNYSSPLNKLEDFHVCSGQLPQDIMHVLIEGSIPYTMKAMLQSFVNIKKYFTINHVNEKILCFRFSRNDCRSKPSQLSSNILDEGNFHQSAAQMWNLAVHFPLMIGDLVPESDSEWDCFLLLLEILQICVTWIISADLVAYLEALIENYLLAFRDCYPDLRIIPKQHYMIHLPSQILRLGPLTNSWCMRMEAKHSYFKKIAQQGNFKNITLSVSKRHQKLMCALLNSGDFFEKSVIISNGIKSQTPLSIEPDWIQCSVASHAVETETTVTRPKWIEWEGNTYHPCDFVLCGYQEELPQFGKIIDIIVVESKVFFCLSLYVTKGINRHFNSFIIEPTENKTVKLLSCNDQRLLSFYAHSLGSTMSGTLYIVSKYFIFKF